MASRRWLLVALSLSALVLLVYAGISVAFSVPVTDQMESASRLPDATDPHQGTRAVVVPVVDPTTVPTLRVPGDENTSGYPGAYLLIAERTADFPASSQNASIVRALAFVAPTANGSYEPAFIELVGVPSGNTTENVTLDVAKLAGGKTGFFVKADPARDAQFIETSRVVGQIARYDNEIQVWLLFAAGGFGFVAPLVLLILTHRGSSRRGAAVALTGVCPECRAPITPGAEFCLRCGAWLSREVR